MRSKVTASADYELGSEAIAAISRCSLSMKASQLDLEPEWIRIYSYIYEFIQILVHMYIYIYIYEYTTSTSRIHPNISMLTFLAGCSRQLGCHGGFKCSGLDTLVTSSLVIWEI